MDNCTLVDLRTFAQMTFNTAPMESAYAYVRTDNLVYYAPNKTNDAETGDNDIDLTELWAATNPGVRETTNPLDTSFATVGKRVAARYELRAGSAGYKSATGGFIPVDDFYGSLRGAQTSRGAFD